MVDEPGSTPSDVTRLLQEWRAGDAAAMDALIPLVYRQLHLLAASHLSRESRGHTLQPTALVHEAFIKLAGQQRVQWQNRAHFFGIAAQLMRRILVDHARRQHRAKRGGWATQISIDDNPGIDPPIDTPVDAIDIYALDRALQKLERLDARQGRIVELRFFGGLSVEEAAEVMSLSTGTIKREWALARAMLFRDLEGAPPD